MVITFAGALQQALAYCMHLNAEQFEHMLLVLLLAETLNTVESLLTVTVARSRVVSTSVASFLITNW